MSRIATALLAGALLTGCATPKPGDWKYSEVAAAVEAYRGQHIAGIAELPRKIRSVRIDGADQLTVYLSDSPGLSGHGRELKLVRTPTGEWIVTGSRLFDY